jgi:hypothetical protein
MAQANGRQTKRWRLLAPSRLRRKGTILRSVVPLIQPTGRQSRTEPAKLFCINGYRIRIADLLQNLTGSNNPVVTNLNVAGYPLQNRRHFYIEFSNVKYNLLAFLITAIYQ